MGRAGALKVAPYLQFPLFYSAHFRALWRYLIRIGAERSLAEDLAQDAFVRWSTSRAIEWPEDRARAYLFTIATRLLTDWWRRRRRDISWDDVGEEPQAIEMQPGSLFSSRAWAVLSPRQQQLLWLAYVEEFTHDEIASIADVSSGSVRVLLSRARALLSAEIDTTEERVADAG